MNKDEKDEEHRMLLCIKHGHKHQKHSATTCGWTLGPAIAFPRPYRHSLCRQWLIATLKLPCYAHKMWCSISMSPKSSWLGSSALMKCCVCFQVVLDFNLADLHAKCCFPTLGLQIITCVLPGRLGFWCHAAMWALSSHDKGFVHIQPAPNFHMGVGMCQTHHPFKTQTSIYSRRKMIKMWSFCGPIGAYSHARQQSGKPARKIVRAALMRLDSPKRHSWCLLLLINDYISTPETYKFIVLGNLSFGYFCLEVFMFRTGFVEQFGFNKVEIRNQSGRFIGGVSSWGFSCFSFCTLSLQEDL